MLRAIPLLIGILSLLFGPFAALLLRAQEYATKANVLSAFDDLCAAHVLEINSDRLKEFRQGRLDSASHSGSEISQASACLTESFTIQSGTINMIAIVLMFNSVLRIAFAVLFARKGAFGARAGVRDP